MKREEAARFLNKPQSWLRYAEWKRLIPYYKIGRQVRYRLGDLEEWLEARRVSQAAHAQPTTLKESSR